MATWCVFPSVGGYVATEGDPPATKGPLMTEPGDGRHEEHLDASEDDGSAELQPEDGGTAPSPPAKE